MLEVLQTVLLLAAALGAAGGCLLLLRSEGARRRAEGQQQQAFLAALEEQQRLWQAQLAGELRATRQEIAQAMHENSRTLGEMLTQSQQQAAGLQDRRLQELTAQFSARSDALQNTVAQLLGRLDERFKSFSLESEQKLENVRATMENRLSYLQQDNARQLEKIRGVVDEKLQKTLEERLAKSFGQVSAQLAEVYKGLGEMQSLAAGVGDLKKVLSNVKTRGILGEIQLGAILEQLLAPEQYEANVATRPGSANVVEYAIRLPGEGKEPVYLPVDAKFPGDCYAHLMDAYEQGDAAAVELAAKELEKRVRQSAKDIHDKYIEPPYTTDFAILFLPFEGLYAEVVNRGMVERLQREFSVSVAGPTTMAALLNALQMGFRTLAIQKRSGEVWQVLGAVRTEFDKFGEALATAQRRVEQVQGDLEKLVGVRTRAIQRRLGKVTALPEESARQLLEAGEEEL